MGQVYHGSLLDRRPGEGVLEEFWGGDAVAGTLEPLTYTRASSAAFLLPYIRVNSPNPPYPRVAVSLV